jgi:flagellar assembly protein FliH
MSISHLLEDFGAYARGTPISLTDVSLEEQRLEAFEKGYQAGWDDSVKAQSDDSRHITADFARNLQELSFTYHEAHAAALNSLEPLLRQMVEVVLPKVARETLGARLIEVLEGLAKTQGTGPIELVTAPANVTALEEILSDNPAMPMSIIEEDSLIDGQVFIRFGNTEHEIDLSQVLEGLDLAVSGFFEENRKETA